MTYPRLDCRIPVVPTLTVLPRNANVQVKVSTRGTMNTSSQVRRRSVFVGVGALTVAGVLGSSMTSVATPGDVRRNSRDIQDRFQALRVSQQLQVRRAADWWGKNFDLTTLSRAHHVLAPLDLNELSVATRDSVLSALWIFGLSKEGVGPWHRA